jgi:putative hemolysin
MLPPEDARKAGGRYAERLFDPAPLGPLRDRLVEVGRVCVHPGHRSGSLMLLMWSALTRYLVERGHDHFFGSASVGLLGDGRAAAGIYRTAAASHLSPEGLRVRPRIPLPLDVPGTEVSRVPPPLLRAYLGLGAWICGEPALDEDFGSADFPVLLALSRLQARYARHFLERAA